MDSRTADGVFKTSWKIYAGVFLTTLATLLLELLLTRIWSVTMWYHFAFVAVSLAMFGMTGGALLVYLLPKFFPPQKTQLHLCLSSLCFAISIVVSFLCHIAIPFMPDKSISGLFAMALSYFVEAVPFLFSGILVTLVLTRSGPKVNYIYAIDLLGAAFGCLAFLLILNYLDGPSAIIATSIMSAIASILLSPQEKMTKASMLVAACLIALLAVNLYSVSLNKPLIRLLWVKAAFETRPFFEKWNSLSRISIEGEAKNRFAHPDWRFNKHLEDSDKMKDLLLCVDSLYVTGMPCFTGNYEDTQYLKHDVSFLAHHIRPNAKVLIIGVGGGRDILAALTFQQKSIVAVEINKIFVDILTKTFSDMSGRFALDPKVTLINDEARSFTSRQKDKFDIIQLSFISTGTATGTGAYALSENSLYTTQAWKMFLDHLNSDGILTCTRDYFRDKSGRPLPGELQRLICLARTALESTGIKKPQDHLICITQTPSTPILEGLAGVTVLLSKSPFKSQDIQLLEKVAQDNNFHILIKPNFAADSLMETLASGTNIAALQEEFPTRLDAPTDDNPFFFYIMRFSNLFSVPATDVGTYVTYTKAMEILVELLVVVVLLSVSCFLVPLAITSRKLNWQRDLPLLFYFAAVGLAFMFIEVSQLQRLVIFLGHPTYSLSVVLFSLLLSSGLGSFLSSYLAKSYKLALVGLGCLILVAVAYMPLSTQLVEVFATAMTPERIAVTIALIFPLGLFMGMAIPLGINLATAKSPGILPWLWGINGATSVCASVLTIAVSINWGLSASYWTGVTFYLLSIVFFACATKVGASYE